MSQAILTPNRKRLLVVGADFAPESSGNGQYTSRLAEHLLTKEAP